VAVGHPDRLERAVVVACGAAASAEQIALCAVQDEAIRADPAFRGGDYYGAAPGEGPHRGMGIARRVGHLSYRSEPELQARFGRAPQPGRIRWRSPPGSMVGTPWSRISTTTPTSWPDASTPAATSSSPRR